ncbi:hypothetical protein [Amycolatopsis sp. SID8362]|uniref:hypothetical protein n=1 Tax=Amycolatopsis sp. SID8362 TaxID=2690346 RepID=UPI00136CDE46|nr:hypothetical protein [Amycolatopsis sp. SID8362]NBH03848.1 hypothetical protein [Amycolatopsis sp. SID8362]NED40548.1 hypothetical protein [Amycolatopsis sp. SID8362]
MGEFDPYRLIDEVETLLVSHGLAPSRIPGRGGDRLAGASRLLRGFGLEPRLSPEDAFGFGVPFQGRINQD